MQWNGATRRNPFVGVGYELQRTATKSPINTLTSVIFFTLFLVRDDTAFAGETRKRASRELSNAPPQPVRMPTGSGSVLVAAFRPRLSSVRSFVVFRSSLAISCRCFLLIFDFVFSDPTTHDDDGCATLSFVALSVVV